MAHMNKVERCVGCWCWADASERLVSHAGLCACQQPTILDQYDYEYCMHGKVFKYDYHRGHEVCVLLSGVCWCSLRDVRMELTLRLALPAPFLRRLGVCSCFCKATSGTL